MTTESLVKILGNFNNLEKIELQDLLDLRDQYPYSQNFQILVAKKKQLLGNDDSDEAFQNLTNFIVNKNHLHERFADSEAEHKAEKSKSEALDKLIEDELFLGQLDSQGEEDLLSDTSDNEEESDLYSVDEGQHKEISDIIHSIEGESIESEARPIIYHEVSDIDDKVVVRSQESDITIDSEDEDLDFISVKPVKLPKSSKKKKENETKIKAKKADEKMKTKKKKNKKTKEKKAKALKKESKNSAKEIKKKLKKEREDQAKKVFTENLDSFSTWLASLSPAKKGEIKIEKQDSKAILVEEVSKKTDSRKKKKTKKSKKKKKKLQNKINSSQQRKSVVVSETLAEIMANQGHIKQSIDIYNQLMLLYPEKSGYFASQIKKLD